MAFVSPRLRKSARGQECTLRLPGICVGGTETTVLCHLPSHIGLKGAGMKVPDWWAVFGCHACHDVIDGRRLAGQANVFAPYVLDAVQRTWAVWFDLGLLRAAGDDREPRSRTIAKMLPKRPLTRSP